MATLKQLRERIAGVKSTVKITKAMQMVAAARLRKIKDSLLSSKEYMDIVSEMYKGALIQDITSGKTAKEKLFLDNSARQTKHLILILSTDRGLCGTFNTSLLKKIIGDLEELETSGEDFAIAIWGKRAHNVLKNRFGSKIIHVADTYLATMTDSEKIIGKLWSIVELDKSIGRCAIYYNQLINTIKQLPTKLTLFPIDSVSTDKSEYHYELEGKNLLESIIDLYLSAVLYKVMVEHKASEESARMTAMDSATKNAEKIIIGLTSELNRTRQAKVTKELIEIVAGAEVV